MLGGILAFCPLLTKKTGGRISNSTVDCLPFFSPCLIDPKLDNTKYLDEYNCSPLKCPKAR